MADKKRGLGRGIDALFSEMPELTEEKTDQDESVVLVNLNEIRENPYQPRKEFDREALEGLAQSIQENGVLQPIILRQSSAKGYEIVAGERRVRASRLAGLETIPAIIRELDEDQMLELAILENLQREDLTILEEAEAYKSMMDKLDLTQAEVAKRLGKSRPHVTNTIRLLKLPTEVKKMIQAGQLSSGQSRTLLGLTNKEQILPLAKEVVTKQMTVREIEKKVSELNHQKTEETDPKTPTASRKPVYIRDTENVLMSKLKTGVSISQQKGGQGKIEIKYSSLDDLTRILDVLEITVD